MLNLIKKGAAGVALGLTAVIVTCSLGFAGVSLNGAGATFPAPLYQKWGYEYNKDTSVQINYQAIGSGGGIQQLTNHTVNFAGTDAYMTDEQEKAVGEAVFHLPAAMGAVVLAYNLPGVADGIKMTPKVLADIFLGNITKWNDEALVSLNPGMNLPDMAINVAHRSDGSGTTNIFTNYLTKVSTKWASTAGYGTAVNWPVGVGGKGNDGVAGVITQVPGTLGYIELAYALQNKLSYARIRNRAGNYPDATIDNVTEAAAGALAHMPSNFKIMFTNAPGQNSYPIAGFTWILVYAKYSDHNIGEAVVSYLNWAMDKGMSMEKDLYYAPLPDSLVAKVKAKIAEIKY
jgi:phosphate transport system substrate-binding protein